MQEPADKPRASGRLATLRKVTRSTSFRLTSAVVATLVLAALICIAALFWQVNALLTRQMANDIERRVAALGALASRSTPQAFAGHIALLSQNDSANLYLLVSEKNRQQPLAGNLRRWPSTIADDGTPAVFTANVLEGTQQLAIGVGVRIANNRSLLVARDADVLRQLGYRLSWWLLFGLFVVVIVGISIGLFVSHTILGRIGQITATSERIMAGRLADRIPRVGSEDELDELAANLNRMLSRIEELILGFREVSDNIAHDLKTPLNRLRNRAEEALNGTCGETDYRQSLERILDEADDLIRTFNALLQVARLEAGANQESLTEFDLAHLARDIADFYAPVAEESGGQLIATQSRPVPLVANRQLVSQALTNLIENALKYGGRVSTGCPETQTVDIQVDVFNSEDEKEIVLAVADHGRGIQPDDRERAIKRFGRLDSSRSQPGTGLGLSLVAAVMRLHRGRIVLGDNMPGLIVTLHFPAPR
ncbi:MAG: sensor histidine kinase [Hyphomicrobiaceae bacterium]